jgi:hypothetical protein
MDKVVARSLPARGRWAVALILLIFVTVATTPPVEAQCTLASSPFPASLAGAGNLGNFNVAGFASQLYISNNGTRMSLLGNYGAVAFDTTNPGAPRATGYLNIINVLGPIPGDGQSYPDAFYVSPDGARVLFNINKVNSDNLIGIMSAAGGFDIQGAFGPPTLRGEVVQQIQQGATRYVAYLLTSNGLGVLDMTTLSGSSQRAGEMSTETTPFPAGSLIQLAPPYVAYIDANGKVTVIDVSNPGPKGSIASGLHSYALDGTAWGHPAPDQPVTIAIATDPADQSALPKLFLFGEFLNTTTGVYSYSLAQFTPALGASPVGGSFTPPSPYVTGLRSATASPNGTELGLFWWVKAPVRVTGLQYDQLRLYSSSLTDWRVSNPPQSIDINPASFSGNFPTVWDTKVIRATETSAFAYTATGYAAMVIPMTCLAANSPAVASLTVQRDPCPTDGVTPCQLDPTKNIIDVYLGETLKITPQIVPLPTPQRPLLDWRFDFDFHEGGADDFGVAGQYPRLKLPDKSDPSGNPPPASFRLIGPCDPNVSGTAPDTGSGCWNSVKNNGPFAFGVPDYTGEPPFNSSAQTTLTLAFEAKNGLGSNGLFKFPIRWNVPKVRLKSSSILGSSTSPGTVDDGSDGTPLATG